MQIRDDDVTVSHVTTVFKTCAVSSRCVYITQRRTVVAARDHYVCAQFFCFSFFLSEICRQLAMSNLASLGRRNLTGRFFVKSCRSDHSDVYLTQIG